jgi:hypothetical protein
MNEEVRKLLAIHHLQISDDLFKQMAPKLVRKYRLRAATETVTKLAAPPARIRYPLLVILFWCRKKEVIDHLGDLLEEITHKIGKKAENTTKAEVIQELQKVEGKNKHIINLLEATVNHPDGVIQETLYSIVSPSTIRDIIQEMKKNKREYRQKIYTKMHSSYQGHYRKAYSDILGNLEFRSNNEAHQPVIEALDLIQEHAQSGQRYFAIDDDVPVEGVIQPKWQDVIIETDSKGVQRINQVNYEIAVSQSLRTRLRCKEIWIAGGDRYRNPEEDLPHDFEEHKEEHFQALKIPLDVEIFISEIKQVMKDRLSLFNQGWRIKVIRKW